MIHKRVVNSSESIDPEKANAAYMWGVQFVAIPLNYSPGSALAGILALFGNYRCLSIVFIGPSN